MEKLYKNVEKYLKKSAKINDCRQVMATIQHNNGKQVISNGFGVVVFDEWCADLELLPTTREELSLNLLQFIPTKTMNLYKEIKEEEKAVLNGLKSYIKEYKKQEFYQKGEPAVIRFCNKIFNAEFLNDIVSIVGDIDNLQVFNDDNVYHGTIFKSDKTTAMLLPCRESSFASEFLQKIEKFKNKIFA